jgi:hypothetical protein
MRRAVMLGLCAYLCAPAWWLVDRLDRVGHELTAVIAVAMATPEPPPDADGGITFVEYDG